eukprot:338245_1
MCPNGNYLSTLDWNYCRIFDANELLMDVESIPTYPTHATRVAAYIIGKEHSVIDCDTTAKWAIKLVDVKMKAYKGSRAQSLYTIVDALDSILTFVQDILIYQPEAKIIINHSWVWPRLENDHHFDPVINDPDSEGEINNKIKLTKEAGAIIIAAAGNQGADANNYSPASSSHAITVGAIDVNAKAWSKSNYGSAVDFYSYGVNVPWYPKGIDDKHQFLTGTSYAAPLIAGVVINILLLDPSKNGDQIKEALTQCLMLRENTGAFASADVPKWNCNCHKKYTWRCWFFNDHASRRRLLISGGDIFFRLENKETGKCIYSDSNDILSYELCDRLRDEQFWTMDDITYDNYFKLRNKVNNKCIYDNGASSSLSISSCLNSDSYYWSLPQSSYTATQYFIIQNKYSQKLINLDNSNNFGLISASSQTGSLSAEASGKTLNINCGAAEINIISAIYGENCASSNSDKEQTFNLAAECRGESVCSYTVDHTEIGDPASGCGKTYQYEYICRDSAQFWNILYDDYVSINSYNYPSYYWTHNGNNGDININSNPSNIENQYFRIKYPALNGDEDYISFESYNNPNYYLRDNYNPVNGQTGSLTLNLATKVLSFGFRTHIDETYAGSGLQTLTLIYDSEAYSCSFVAYPSSGSQAGVDFLCDGITSIISAGCTNSNGNNELLIESSGGGNALILDRIYVTPTTGNPIIITPYYPYTTWRPYRVCLSTDGGSDGCPTTSTKAKINIANSYVSYGSALSFICVTPSSFQNDASFKIVKSLIVDATYISFESANQADHYIRQRGGKLYIDPSENSDLYKQDASFIMDSELFRFWNDDNLNGNNNNNENRLSNYIGQFGICVKDTSGGETLTDTIQARIWYLDNNEYMTADWTFLGANFGAESKGKCIYFHDLVEYADKEWKYIDLSTCDNDGLTIDKIIYWDISTYQYQTLSAFDSSVCTVNGDYFWLDGNHMTSSGGECWAISIELSTGSIYMNPSWISGQSCETYINEADLCTIEVIETEETGKYFNFYDFELNLLLGRNDWSGNILQIHNSRTNQISSAYVWSHTYAEHVAGYTTQSIIGSGRWTNWQYNDFQSGDRLTITKQDLHCEPKCYFKALSVEHSNGLNGEYINFVIEVVDVILGRSNWHAENFNIYNTRTKQISKYILWRNPYAGGTGGIGHGRKNDGTQNINDFQTGDMLSFVGINVNCNPTECPLNVESHIESGGIGRYYTFTVTEANVIFGGSTTYGDYPNNRQIVLLQRTQEVMKVTIWPSSAWGRRDDNGGASANYGDFQDGDQLSFI